MMTVYDLNGFPLLDVPDGLAGAVLSEK